MVVAVYDRETEELLEEFEGSSEVNSVAIWENESGQGWIVAGVEDGTIKVWDAASLELKAEKQSAHSSYVFSVAFSPDGKTVVSGSWDKTLKVWSADTLQLVEERKGDGSALDASGSGAVAEHDGATLRLKEGGGVFYAPATLLSVAVHWPRLVAGAETGELYHLEVQG